jgi:putative membrane protein
MPNPHHQRRPTYPLAHAARQKPRRIPLVLRVTRGSVHASIAVPVILHSLFTVLIVYLDRHVGNLGLPALIIPSLSIVVGLMLVFRNGTSYDRFWSGRNCLTSIGTCVRNLTRSFLVSASPKAGEELKEAEKEDVEKTVRVLVAILYAVKHSLRAEYSMPPASAANRNGHGNGEADEGGITTAKAEYISLLPDHLVGFEDQGLSLPLQLTVLVESYIKRAFERGWVHGPQASQLTTQVNALVDAYGRMETIRSTPMPVAHLYALPNPYPLPFGRPCLSAIKLRILH